MIACIPRSAWACLVDSMLYLLTALRRVFVHVAQQFSWYTSLCLICRQQLQHLAAGTSQEGIQAIQSRPGAPLWLRRQPGRLTAMFPVYLHGSADDPLLSAFIQVLLRFHSCPIMPVSSHLHALMA